MLRIWLVAGIVLAAAGCGDSHGGGGGGGGTSLRAYAASDACHHHTGTASCTADSACTWSAIEACPAGAHCPGGVCGEADPCAAHADRVGCEAAGGCACACPACAPGESCPPCDCDCSGGMGASRGDGRELGRLQRLSLTSGDPEAAHLVDERGVPHAEHVRCVRSALPGLGRAAACLELGAQRDHVARQCCITRSIIPAASRSAQSASTSATARRGR